MTIKLMPNLKILAVILVSLLGFQSCKNPAEDVNVQISTDVFKSPTVLVFENANPNSPALNKVNISFSGPGASLVRTITGSKNFSVSNGFLNIVLDKNANPSATNPIKVTATVTAPGYAPNYIDLVFSDPKEEQFYTLKMFEYNRPAEGTAAVITTQELNGGQSTTPIIINTIPNASQPQSTTITIPANTGFKDASGNIINGNQIETRVIYSAVKSDGKVNTDKANRTISNAFDENGVPISGEILEAPIASASINMYAGSTAIKSFTNPIDLDLELPSNFINPATNKPLKVGEQLNAWSLNEETGQWKRDGFFTIVQNGSKLVARKQITSLSEKSATVLPEWFTGTISVVRDDLEFARTFYTNAISYYIAKGVANRNIKRNAYAINGVAQSIDIEAGDKDVYEQSKFIFTPDKVNYNVTANFIKKPSVINAELKLDFKCSNKKLTISPSVTLKLENLKTKNISFVTVTNGKAVGSFLNGDSYRIIIDIDGVDYSTTFKVNNGSAEIESVDNLVASVSKTSTGFSVNAEITKPCN